MADKTTNAQLNLKMGTSGYKEVLSQINALKKVIGDVTPNQREAVGVVEREMKQRAVFLNEEARIKAQIRKQEFDAAQAIGQVEAKQIAIVAKAKEFQAKEDAEIAKRNHQQMMLFLEEEAKFRNQSVAQTQSALRNEAIPSGRGSLLSRTPAREGKFDPNIFHYSQMIGMATGASFGEAILLTEALGTLKKGIGGVIGEVKGLIQTIGIGGVGLIGTFVVLKLAMEAFNKASAEAGKELQNRIDKEREYQKLVGGKTIDELKVSLEENKNAQAIADENLANAKERLAEAERVYGEYADENVESWDDFTHGITAWFDRALYTIKDRSGIDLTPGAGILETAGNDLKLAKDELKKLEDEALNLAKAMKDPLVIARQLAEEQRKVTEAQVDAIQRQASLQQQIAGFYQDSADSLRDELETRQKSIEIIGNQLEQLAKLDQENKKVKDAVAELNIQRATETELVKRLKDEIIPLVSAREKEEEARKKAEEAAKKIAELQRDAEYRRQDLLRDLQHRLQDAARQGRERRFDLEHDFNVKLYELTLSNNQERLDQARDHLLNMQKLERDFNRSFERARKERDAVAAMSALENYNDQKADAQLQEQQALEDRNRSFQQQREAANRAYQEQLYDLQMNLTRQNAEIRLNYNRQRQELELNLNRSLQELGVASGKAANGVRALVQQVNFLTTATERMQAMNKTYTTSRVQGSQSAIVDTIAQVMGVA